jgi:Toprim domain
MNDAETLTRSLGGKWHGNRGLAPCPVCQPERRSDQQGLSLCDDGGRLLAFCHKSGCTFRDIAQAVAFPRSTICPDTDDLRAANAERIKDQARRAAQAKALLDGAAPAKGSPVEAYLRGRGIIRPLPDTLRFHPQGWHATGHHHPIMVARVDGAAAFAVHRTYLSGVGVGKARVTPDKAMLGPCAGGAVRLSHGVGPLVVCEGVETGLSLLCDLLRAPAMVWAALSTSGMRALHLPPVPGRMIIAADGDPAGRDAAVSLATRADALGWTVSLLPALQGQDWNDRLT